MTEEESESLEIVRRAMEDRSVYEEMASKESEVWSSLLPNLETSDASAVDREASRELYVGRHQSTLVRQTKERDLQFSSGVTLGCGAGRLERELIDAGVCEKFHGVDIAEGAIASAKSKLLKRKTCQLPTRWQILTMLSFQHRHMIWLSPKRYYIMSCILNTLQNKSGNLLNRTAIYGFTIL